MDQKVKQNHRVAFYTAIITAVLFIFSHTIGQSNNIEFKDPDVKKICNGFLNLTLIISLFFTIVFLWRLVEDSTYTKAVITAPVAIAGFWAVTIMLGDMFNSEWHTRKLTALHNDPVYTHLAEQEKSTRFFHTKITRTICVKSYLGFFWKVKVIPD